MQVGLSLLGLALSSDTGATFSMRSLLFLTDNGVVLCYNDVAPMYLTFHYSPPHEQDPGGLKHEEKQRAAGVSSSFEEATPSLRAPRRRKLSLWRGTHWRTRSPYAEEEGEG